MVVISIKKYSPGDLISSELPFILVLDNKAKSTNCDSCTFSSDEKKLKKCSSCKQMYYCSKECQKTDWISGHKYECDVFKHHYNLLQNQDTKIREMLRLYLVLKNNKKLVSQKVDFQYVDKTVERSLKDLVTPKEEIKKNRASMEIFQDLIQLYNQCNIEIDQFTLFEVFCICTQYSSVLGSKFNSPEEYIGQGIYLGYSAFSHSCSPNTTRIPNGLRMDIRAIKEINIGDEIFTKRTKLNQDKKSRQEELKHNFYFDCHCQRCNSDFDKGINYERMKILEIEMDHYEFHSTPPQVELALEKGKELIPLYKQIFGYDAFLTLTLMRVVELYKRKMSMRNMMEKDFFNIVNETVQHLKITHGFDSKLYQDYKGFATKFNSIQDSFFPR